MNRPNSEINARLGITDQENMLPTWLPFAVLLGGGIILLLNWENIPDRWVTHWGVSGQPDGWTSKSPAGVFTPIGFGILICGFLELMARWIASQKVARGIDVSPEVVSVMAGATANFVRLTSLAISALLSIIGVALPLYQPRSPALVVGSAFAFIGLAILVGLRRYYRVHQMLKERGLLGDAKGWHIFGYNNPSDPRLWVPKPFVYGYTINFGHRWAWPVFLLMLAVPLMVMILILLLAG